MEGCTSVASRHRTTRFAVVHGGWQEVCGESERGDCQAVSKEMNSQNDLLRRVVDIFVPVDMDLVFRCTNAHDLVSGIKDNLRKIMRKRFHSKNFNVLRQVTERGAYREHGTYVFTVEYWLSERKFSQSVLIQARMRKIIEKAYRK